MSDVVQLLPREHLWLWRPDRGEWTQCGTGAPSEMATALAAATQAAAALGFDATYAAAARKPAPLHPGRRITVDLPEPVADEDALVWEGPDYDVTYDQRGHFLSAEPPPFDAITADEVVAWRSFALAVLAATQTAATPADAA